MFYNKLLSLEGKKQENLYIYLVETTAFDGESFVDVCLYDESSDEIFAMDFVDWSEVIDLKIKNTIKLSRRSSFELYFMGRLLFGVLVKKL